MNDRLKIWQCGHCDPLAVADLRGVGGEVVILGCSMLRFKLLVDMIVLGEPA